MKQSDFSREELIEMDEMDLDEIVCDMKSAEASEINNSGREAQIAYILGNAAPDSETDNVLRKRRARTTAPGI